MPFEQVQNEQENRLTLRGTVEINEAGELKSALLDLLTPGKAMVIALDAVEELDVTALQLLLSVEHSARDRAIPLSFTALGAEAQALLNLAGIPFPISVSSSAQSTTGVQD